MKGNNTFWRIILIVSILGFSSCSKEGCTDSAATNYDSKAKEDDGSCQYPDPRDEFVGDYSITDSLFWRTDPPPWDYISMSTYILSISKDPNFLNKLILDNLWNQGSSYEAILSGSAFSIPSQQIIGGDYVVTGNDTFNGPNINYETTGVLPGTVPSANIGSGTKPN